MKPKKKLLIVVISLASASILAVVLPCGDSQVSDSEADCTRLCEGARLVIIAGIMAASMFLFRYLPDTKITAASLAEGLHTTAVMSVTVVLVMAVAPMAAPTLVDWPMNTAAPKNGASNGELFTAAATIMALTVFGSALGTLGSNKHLIKSIAYTLIPIITVQMVFMLHLVGIFYFPVVVWILMTGILLMLSVLAMVANWLLPDETDGTTTTTQNETGKPTNPDL